jgi:hypothetical protein
MEGILAGQPVQREDTDAIQVMSKARSGEDRLGD